MAFAKLSTVFAKLSMVFAIALTMNPNIWSLPRSPRIRHLLLLLSEQLGDDSFLIDTSTQVDAGAIYLQHRQDVAVRAYIYTHGQLPERYGVHLEYPASVEPHENVELQSLVEMLAVHLDIADIRPLPQGGGR